MNPPKETAGDEEAVARKARRCQTVLRWVVGLFLLGNLLVLMRVILGSSHR